MKDEEVRARVDKQLDVICHPTPGAYDLVVTLENHSLSRPDLNKERSISGRRRDKVASARGPLYCPAKKVLEFQRRGLRGGYGCRAQLRRPRTLSAEEIFVNI